MDNKEQISRRVDDAERETLRRIIDAVPYPILVIDPEGSIAAANPRALHIFGYEGSELLDQPIEVLVPERFRSAHGALCRDWLFSPNARPLDSGRDLSGVRKDGRKIAIEIGLESFTMPSGTFALATIVDIAARNSTSDQLRLIVEAAPNAMIMTRIGGDITMVNTAAERMFGYSRQELIGRSVDMLVPARYRSAHPVLRQSYDAAPSARPMGAGRDLFGVRKDGCEVPIEIGLNSIVTPQGGFVLASIIDISERKRAEELRIAGMEQQAAELAQLNAELESFSYSISHDLRAPVRAIIGFARAIAEEYESALDDEGQRLLGVVQSEAARMADLIDDLLAFAQLGRQPLRRASVGMMALARDVAAELTQGTAKVVIEIEDLPKAYGDRALLRQVWTNLLSNAIKYSSKETHPHVRVYATSEADSVVYHVTDNGVGFEMKYADKLFGVFQRLHRNDEFEGTGVGLAIVQRIVHRHGGRVRAEAALGKGATLSFTIAPAGE